MKRVDRQIATYALHAPTKQWKADSSMLAQHDGTQNHR
jgi:hypothetical protein